MDWDLLDEVDVISQWGSQQKNVESAKWSERKEALEGLIAIIEKNPRLSTVSLTIYGELMDNLRKILKSDSNVAVVMAALKCVALLADGLRSNFSGFVSMTLPHVLEKAKDKKQPVRDLVSAALDSISSTCSPERIQKDVVEHLQKPSPQAKQCVASFLYRYFKKQTQSPVDFLKATLPLLVKLASDSDSTVRECACEAIGSAKRLLGEGITAFLQPINADKKKLDKIEEALAKATAEWKEEMAARGVSSGGGDAAGCGTSAQGETTGELNGDAVAAPVAVDPWTLKEPQDVAAQLSKEWHTMIVSKKWQDRKEAVDHLAKELESEPRIQMTDALAEVMAALIKVITADLNVNVVGGAAKSLSGVAKGLRTEFKQYTSKALSICFDRLKDKKPALREELVGLADSAALTTTSTEFTEVVTTALGNKNPQTRSQTCLFIHRLFLKHDKSTLPVADVKTLAPAIQKCCSDGDAEVRENSLRVVATVVRILGEGALSAIFPEVAEEKLKIQKVQDYAKELGENENIPKTAHPQIKKLYESAQPKANGSAPVTAKPGAPVKQPATSGPKPFKARPAPTFRPVPIASRPRPTPAAPPVAPRPAVPRAPVATRPMPRSVNSTPTASAPVPRRPATSSRPSIPTRPVAPPSAAAKRPVPLIARAAPVPSAPSVAPRVAAPTTSRFGFTPSKNPPNHPAAAPLSARPTTTGSVRAVASSIPRPNSARPSGIPRPGSRPSSRPPSAQGHNAE